MRRRIFEILTNPRQDDRLGRAISVALLMLIAANVVVSVVETDVEIASDAPAVFRWFEIVSVGVFTVEYVARLWSCTASPAVGQSALGRLGYALRPMALIDLLVIAPFYLDVFVPGTLDLRFLRVLRLLRLFRLFRVGPVADGFARLVRIIQAKRAELVVSMSVVVVIALLAAGALYFIEHDQEGSEFTSIPRAMWWSIVTITTIGYGDMAPVTSLGRAVGGVVAILGICSLALPVGIISSGYIDDITKQRQAAGSAATPGLLVGSGACPHCGRRGDRVEPGGPVGPVDPLAGDA